MRVTDYWRYLSSLDESAQARVLSSIQRTAAGNGLQDFVTPLLGDGDPDVLREEVRDYFLHRLPLQRFPWLRVAEEAQAQKIGSYSMQLPYIERRDNVHAYFAPNPGKPDLNTLRTAIRATQELMPKDLDPIPLSDAIEEMPKGTNLGAPVFTSDKRYLSVIGSEAERVEREGFSSDEYLPALMFFRGQPRGIGEVTKNRTVWGISHITIAHGLRVQRPLLEHLKQRMEFAAWNESGVVDRAVTHAFDTGRQQIISADFSGYDASLHPALLEGAWSLIRSAFRGRHSLLLIWLEEQMKYVPLITPEGIISGAHAMPSGDALTNMVDGLCQIILWNYVALKLGLMLLFVTVQGDDGVVIFSRPVDITEVSSIINTDFGMSLSTDKGQVSADQVSFLQNEYHRYFKQAGINVGVRPIMRVINGMLSYERLVKKSLGWSGYADTIRWWQQAENARFHPSFDLLVKYLWDNDRYSRLPATRVMHKAGDLAKVERLLKQSSFPYGKEPLSRLEQFAVVKGLNRLRVASLVDQGVQV